MNALTPQGGRVEAMPVLRWFIYLLFCVIGTLVIPYTANPTDRYQLPHVATFQKIGDSMVPSHAEIWIDGRSAAELNDNFWLYFGLALIALEFLVFIVRRLVASRKHHSS